MAMPLGVLMIEDSEDDALLLVSELRRGGDAPTWERVDTPEAMRVALVGLEKGASGFVEKPITRETFLDAVRQATLRWQLRRPSTRSN